MTNCIVIGLHTIYPFLSGRYEMFNVIPSPFNQFYFLNLFNCIQSPTVFSAKV